MLCTVASPLPPKLAAAVRDTGTGGGRIQPSRASERELGATFQARDACCRKSRCHDPDRRHCSRLQNSDPKPTRRVGKKKATCSSLRFSKKLHHLFAFVLIVSSSHSSLVQFEVYCGMKTRSSSGQSGMKTRILLPLVQVLCRQEERRNFFFFKIKNKNRNQDKLLRRRRERR